MFRTAKLIEAGGRELQDRIDIIEQSGAVILVVADGAGGISGGAEAAQKAVEMVRAEITRLPRLDPVGYSELFAEIDRGVKADPSAGETTLVLVMVTPQQIIGASVGDSEAWLVREQAYERLTHAQIRKPCLGSGAAIPVFFRANLGDGTLVVASDGLFKYTSSERICSEARKSDLQKAAVSLMNLVRLRSGALPDDVGIALCRQV